MSLDIMNTGEVIDLDPAATVVLPEQEATRQLHPPVLRRSPARLYSQTTRTSFAYVGSTTGELPISPGDPASPGVRTTTTYTGRLVDPAETARIIPPPELFRPEDYQGRRRWTLAARCGRAWSAFWARPCAALVLGGGEGGAR